MLAAGEMLCVTTGVTLLGQKLWLVLLEQGTVPVSPVRIYFSRAVPDGIYVWV